MILAALSFSVFFAIGGLRANYYPVIPRVWFCAAPERTQKVPSVALFNKICCFSLLGALEPWTELRTASF